MTRRSGFTVATCAAVCALVAASLVGLSHLAGRADAVRADRGPDDVSGMIAARSGYIVASS